MLPSAIAFFLALVGVTIVIEAWPWIAAQPESAAAFLGSLIGAAAGLDAILIGALANADLNRRRDDRMRQQDRLGLLEALTAELELYRNLLKMNAAMACGQVKSWRPNLKVDDGVLGPIHVEKTKQGRSIREVLRMPAPSLYVANASRIGLLGGEFTALIVHAHARITQCNTVAAEIPPEHYLDNLEGIAKEFDKTSTVVGMAHAMLIAELQEIGGPTSAHISPEKKDEIATIFR